MPTSLTNAPLIRWCLPPSLRGATTARARRCALFVLYNAVLIAAGSPFSYILGIQLGIPLSGLSILAGILMIVAGMGIVRWSGRLDIASHWISCSLFMVLLLISYQTGGITSPGLWWLALCPMYTLLFSGIRDGLLWVNVVVITAIVFYGTGFHARSLANPISRSDLDWLHLSSFLGFTSVVVGYVASYRYFITGNQLQRLNDQRRNERDARKQAERANRAKNQFLANTSHEIRTPINTITGMTDLLRNSTLSDEQRERLDIVDESARQLLDTIDNMLDIARMESGSIELRDDPLRIRSLVHDVLHGLMPEAEKQGIELIQQVDPGIPVSLVGDEKRLRQILMHLVENAITHSGADHVVVRLREDERSDGSCTLRFEVIDDGIGIHPEEQEDIFQSFLRSSHSQAEQKGGSGIGLAICRELVHLHGGEIRVDSAPDEGSTFQFSATFRAPESGFSSPSYASDELNGRTALVLENNPSIVQAITSLFDTWGVTSRVVPTAEEFLDRLDDQPALREGTGFLLIDEDACGSDELQDVLEHVEHLADPRPPTLILTTPTSEASTAAFRRSDGHMTKPLNGPTLHQQLTEAITACSNPASVPEDTDSPDPPAEDGQHLLLVEDNDAVRGVIKMQLQELGHTVTDVSDGEQAVQAVRDHPELDLVIMDVQMPGMDGIEATETIRGLSHKRSDIPIVGLTANSLESNRRRCLDAGMTAFMNKPAGASELQEAIAKHA